jgi:YVTN family beta-propeller protein
MKKLFAFALFIIAIFTITVAQNMKYKIVQTFHIASAGGWDYLAVNNNKLYVSHGTQVNILDKNTGDSLGIIENTLGVHGIAFINSLNKGFTTNGKMNNVTVFDLNTDKPMGQIATGENPDAILYDNFSKKLYTCNGRSNDLSVIDPETQKLIATIRVGGKPETAVSDDAGSLFVNIEDKNEIVEINTQTYKVENHWSLGKGEEPTGLSIDKTTRRLFSACDKLLIVMDAATGKLVAEVPIGEGCDGAAFDPATRNIYTSNGEGTLTVIHENTANDFKVIDNVKTKPGARTIALDDKTHRLFLPTAEFEALAPNAAKDERPKMIAGSFQILVIEK